MKNETNILLDKMNELYRVYEECCWHNNKLEIVIIIDKMMITLYLNDEKGNKDTFGLSFSKMEKRIYKYISLKLFSLVLGDVYIYMDGNVYYNKNHKPYLSVIVNDDDIFVSINKLVFNQENNYIQNSINDVCKRKPFKLIDNKFISQVDERIELSKRRLRSDR